MRRIKQVQEHLDEIQRMKKREGDFLNVNPNQNYLTPDWYGGLKKTKEGRDLLDRWYKNQLERYGDKIRAAAEAEGIPTWLLAGVIFGEMIAMDDFFVSERACEDWGLGSSVGLAQITVEVAFDRGLTPTATGLTPQERRRILNPGNEADRALKWKALGAIRKELLDDGLNIKASARYLKQLAAEAAAAAKGKGAKPSNQWGKVDWKSFDPSSPRGFDDLASSSGYRGTGLGREIVTSFFGAAHNDNRATGSYNPGFGFGQGGNAGQASKDLSRLGFK